MAQAHKQSKQAYLMPRKKDYYQKLYDIFNEQSIKRVWDIGCAAGDFAWYAPDSISFLCTDTSSELINIAMESRMKPNITYEVHDLLSDSPPNEFKDIEAITALGIATLFEDPGEFISSLCEKKARTVVLHATLNPYSWDMLVAHKRSEEPSSAYMQSYNIFSIETIRRLFIENGYSNVSFEPFILTTQLSRDPNRLSSYNVNCDGAPYMMNDLRILMSDYIVVARLSPDE